MATNQSCTLALENDLRGQGARLVAGIDEAGRGPLAGPVYAAAVILPDDFTHSVLTDSKKLNAKKRDALYKELTARGDTMISSGIAEVAEIDSVNILKATHLAMERAASGLPKKPDIVLIDGLEVRGFPLPQQAVVGGDALSLSIAAASIVAKVERDRFMIAQAKLYPEYGFEKHKGYGTKIHMEALKAHGPCPLHRRSFAPVARHLPNQEEK